MKKSKKSPSTRKLYAFIMENDTCRSDVEGIIKASLEMANSSDPNKKTDRCLQASWEIWHYFMALEGSYYMKFWYHDDTLSEEDIIESLPTGKVNGWKIKWYQLAEYLFKRYQQGNGHIV